MENSFNNISDDLELWASDDDIAGHGGRQRHIATSSGVTLAGHQTHAKIAHLKNQRRRGNRQVGVGASGSVQGNAAPRTGHRSAATRPKRITEALERDATIQISTGKPASSSTFAIRTTQSRQSGDTNVVPATDSLATNSLNAEIRGLFERAARVSLSKQATDSTAGTHPEDSQEMHAEEEEELLKTQARHLEEEMSRLREQHFSLAMRSEEMRVRKAASKTLEAFEAKLQNERAGMIQSLKDERNEKMRAAAAFQRQGIACIVCNVRSTTLGCIIMLKVTSNERSFSTGRSRCALTSWRGCLVN